MEEEAESSPQESLARRILAVTPASLRGAWSEEEDGSFGLAGPLTWLDSEEQLARLALSMPSHLPPGTRCDDGLQRVKARLNHTNFGVSRTHPILRPLFVPSLPGKWQALSRLAGEAGR